MFVPHPPFTPADALYYRLPDTGCEPAQRWRGTQTPEQAIPTPDNKRLRCHLCEHATVRVGPLTHRATSAQVSPPRTLSLRMMLIPTSAGSPDSLSSFSAAVTSGPARVFSFIFRFHPPLVPSTQNARPIDVQRVYSIDACPYAKRVGTSI